MDPRNYGVCGQSSPRNNSLNGQSFQGYRLWVSTRCMSRFWWMHGLWSSAGCMPSFQQGCQGFQGCTGCGVQQGACLELRVRESLPNPGFQFVLWDTNARINGLVAVDLETLVSQVLSDYP